MAGLQPHLARVRLIRLWAGWGCTPVVQSKHGTQDKPAITTHTQERATVMTARYSCSACTILQSPINEYSQPSTCVLCRRGPEKPLIWYVAGGNCYNDLIGCIYCIKMSCATYDLCKTLAHHKHSVHDSLLHFIFLGLEKNVTMALWCGNFATGGPFVECNGWILNKY